MKSCLCCEKNINTRGPRVCPKCDYVFRGNGWDGIDRHWKTRHKNDALSYNAFWESLCPAHRYPLEVSHGSGKRSTVMRITKNISEHPRTETCFIRGVPYGKSKQRGNTKALSAWTKTVQDQTSHLTKLHTACELEVHFVLPPNKYPSDLPFGPDLDNLLKRFFDALHKFAFSEVPGKDSCIVTLKASKSKALDGEETGAHLTIRHLS